MNKSKQLPFQVPDFATFHDTAIAEIAYIDKPHAAAQLLNQRMDLVCGRAFLTGFSSPQITIPDAKIYTFPGMHRHCVSMVYAYPFYREIIQRMIDAGSYIYLSSIDDYYIPQKSWYHEEHRLHDGILYGYDDCDDTYTLAAYDTNWVFRSFRIPQKSLEDSIHSALDSGGNVRFIAVLVTEKEFELDISGILKKLKEYISADFSKYPLAGNGIIKGIIVYDYLDIYFDKLLDGSIQHEKLDWRVLRIIWEYRIGMLKRLRAVEEKLKIDTSISTAYGELVQETDRLRMLYALYHRKKKDSLLLSVKNGLLELKTKEKNLLEQFVQKVEEAIST